MNNTKPKTRPISNIAEARALAVFLVKEAHRHAGDIGKIESDLYALHKKWGIEIPTIKQVGEEFVVV